MTETSDQNGHAAIAAEEARARIASALAPSLATAYLDAEPPLREVIFKLLGGEASGLPYVDVEHVSAIREEHQARDHLKRVTESELIRRRAGIAAQKVIDAEQAGDIAARISENLYTAAQLDDIPPVEYLAPSLLAKDSLAWLYGDPGCFKSFAALDIAASVALGAGISWAGIPTTQVPVLYVAAEGSGGMRKRVRAWEAMAGRALGDRITFLTTGPNITEESHLNAVLEVCRNVQPGLIVIDTQSRVTPGLEENGSVMTLYVQAVDRIRQETGGCVLTLHHTTKGTEVLRGHGSLYGAADTVLFMSRTASEERYAKIQIKKQKDDDDSLFWNVGLRVQHFCGLPGEEDHNARECSSLVIAAAHWSDVINAQTTAFEKVRLMIMDLEPDKVVTKRNVMDLTGVPDSTVKRCLKTLCEQGILTKTGAGNDVAYFRPSLTLDDAAAHPAQPGSLTEPH
ncbi:AAA family ATPase [Streptomyces sp. NPDC046925]|uniref:AAA family ATPase n=1 Tax=Streptomyces sp. NPDC046925 TaxID=3155375 RepID=UPI0033CB24E4